MAEIGTVISTPDGPSPMKFSFVVEVEEQVPVKKDQFVIVPTEEGMMYAMVTDVRKTNRYYARAESVREYESHAELQTIFPIDKWEFLQCDCMPLGVMKGGKVFRSTFPPSPGVKVSRVDKDSLSKFLGFKETGLNLGNVQHHGIPAKISLTGLLQKHLAILAQSGAGKSYSVAVLIEELLLRKEGRIAVAVIDTHGEYSNLSEKPENKENKDFSGKVQTINSKDIRIPVPQISPFFIGSCLPDFSGPQQMALSDKYDKLKSRMWKEGKAFDLKDIVFRVSKDREMNEKVKGALINRLMDLDRTGLFGKEGYPSFKKILEPGKAVIFDLSDEINYRKKQILVAYLSRTLFRMRTREEVPPYVLILEEAHNYIPSGESNDRQIARPIFEKIAREGRKFYASLCLISQRPKALSTTVLSQCNTQLILRITNPYDLDHIGNTAEGITRDTLNSITSLQTGEGLLVGSAVNYPVFLRIRKRLSEEKHGSDLFSYARKWEKEEKDLSDDIDGMIERDF